MDADLFTPIPRKTLLGVPCSALFGDCLDVMQGMDSETVDLIYIDPPYYSQADYKGESGAFSDKWESMHQYLNWMVVRLYEMKQRAGIISERSPRDRGRHNLFSVSYHRAGPCVLL